MESTIYIERDDNDEDDRKDQKNKVPMIVTKKYLNTLLQATLLYSRRIRLFGLIIQAAMVFCDLIKVSKLV